MTQDEKLAEALRKFQKQYPMVTSGDLQTFVLGWKAAVENSDSDKKLEIANTALEKISKSYSWFGSQQIAQKAIKNITEYFKPSIEEEKSNLFVKCIDSPKRWF